MPTILLSESQQAAALGEDDLLVPETGELTIEAQTIADFLAHVGFGAVTELPYVAEFASKIKVESADGSTEEIEIVPSEVAFEATDMDDLASMFENYLTVELNRLTRKDATLEEKARATALIKAFELEEAQVDEAGGKFPSGRGKMRKAWKGSKFMKRRAVAQMLAMRNKGVYVRKDGKNVKGPGYSSGGTAAGKKKVATYKAKNKTKIAKAKRLRGVKEDAIDPADFVVFGFNEPVGEDADVMFAASVRADAEQAVAEAKKKHGLKAPNAPMPKGPKDACENAGDGSGRADQLQPGTRNTMSESLALTRGMVGLMESQGVVQPQREAKPATNAS